MNRCRHLATIIAAGMLMMSVTAPAVALNYVSALHSGKLVIATQTSMIFALPSAGMGSASGSHVSILPVLFKNPDSTDSRKSWMSAENQLQSPSDNAALKPYVKQILALPLKEDLLAFGRKAVMSVPWLAQDSLVTLRQDVSLMDTSEIQALTLTGHRDAVAFLHSLIVFSYDFKRVYVIVPVVVYAAGSVRAFYMGSVNLHADESLNETKPELKTYGAEGLAASDRVGKIASEARARAWFAGGSARLKQALASDLEQLRKQLVNYLGGH